MVRHIASLQIHRLCKRDGPEQACGSGICPRPMGAIQRYRRAIAWISWAIHSDRMGLCLCYRDRGGLQAAKAKNVCGSIDYRLSRTKPRGPAPSYLRNSSHGHYDVALAGRRIVYFQLLPSGSRATMPLKSARNITSSTPVRNFSFKPRLLAGIIFSPPRGLLPGARHCHQFLEPHRLFPATARCREGGAPHRLLCVRGDRGLVRRG